MPDRIVGLCPRPECDGTVYYAASPPLPGAVGDCDVCGATFQLVGGITKTLHPPRS